MSGGWFDSDWFNPNWFQTGDDELPPIKARGVVAFRIPGASVAVRPPVAGAATLRVPGVQARIVQATSKVGVS